jgi:serine/threonine-protein kinase HipA
MDASGDWRLAPAYDLTYAPGPGGEHYLDVEGEGRDPTRGHVQRLGARHGLDVKAVERIVDHVAGAVARWDDFAVNAGVSRASRQEIATAHAHVRARFDGR